MENFINILSNTLKSPSFWIVTISSLIVSLVIYKFRQNYSGGSIIIEGSGRQHSFNDLKKDFQPEDNDFYNALNSRKRKISPGVDILLFLDSIGLYLWALPAAAAFFMRLSLKSAPPQSLQIGTIISMSPFLLIMMVIPLTALIFRWITRRKLLHSGVFALAELKAIRETVERRSSSNGGSSYTTFWKGEFEFTDHKGKKRNFFVKRQCDFMEKLVDDEKEWLIFRPQSAKALFSPEPSSRSILDEPLFLDELNVKLRFSLKDGFSGENFFLPLISSAIKAIFILGSFFNTIVFATFCTSIFLLCAHNNKRTGRIRQKIIQNKLFFKG
jgi:hypothetical protein